MLKLLYKTLLVSLLSGSLLMLDFSYKGAIVRLNSVQAETLKTDKIESGSDIASTLTMTGVGLITSRLYGCKLTTDMMIAAAGGVAFLAGEVTSFLAQQKAIKDLETQIERDKNGKPTQQQITILESLKKSYEDARKTANMKKTFQQAAAAAFLAAAISAGIQYAQQTAAQTACTTALATATTGCAALAAACVGVVTCECPTCGAAEAPLGLDTSTRAAKYVKAVMLAPSSAQAASDKASTATSQSAISSADAVCPVTVGADTSCKAADMLDFTSQGVCMKPLVVDMQTVGKALYANQNFTPMVPEKYTPNIFEMIFMPTARADLLSPMGIASSAAVSFVMMTSATLGIKIDTFLFSPMNRAIIWGGMAALAFAASSSTSSQIGKIDENIQKINNILNGMYGLNNGVATAAAPGVQNPTIEKTITPDVKLGVNNYSEPKAIDLSPVGGKLPCMTGEDKSCPSFSTQFNALTAPGSNIGMTQAQLGALKTMADGVNGATTLSSGTIKSAESLASQAVALKGELAKQQKKIQDSLKASGKNVDLAKSSDDLAKDLQSIIDKELKARNTTADAMLASMGSGFGSGSGSASAAIATDANKNAKATAAKKPVIAPVGVVDMSSSLNAGKGLNNGLTLDANKKDDAALTADAAKAGAGATMDDYVLKNDITQDKDSSLFDLISNRYQKSGYPRLFKKIK